MATATATATPTTARQLAAANNPLRTLLRLRSGFGHVPLLTKERRGVRIPPQSWLSWSTPLIRAVGERLSQYDAVGIGTVCTPQSPLPSERVSLFIQVEGQPGVESQRVVYEHKVN